MAITIVDSSPQATEARAGLLEKKYPFEDLEVGKSFTLPKDEANVASLRAVASRKSKGEKAYKVIVHPNVIEVARLA